MIFSVSTKRTADLQKPQYIYNKIKHIHRYECGATSYSIVRWEGGFILFIECNITGKR